MAISSAKELGKELLDDKDTIEIEGKLGHVVIKIKATGKIAWAICIGVIAISVAATATTIGTGGAAAPAKSGIIAVTASAAVPILGLPATMAAVSIAISGGGIAVLQKLRKYKIEYKGNIVILKKN